MLVLSLLTLNMFSNVSTVDLEQANVSWAISLKFFASYTTLHIPRLCIKIKTCICKHGGKSQITKSRQLSQYGLAKTLVSLILL